jgi:WD40 repeat protein
VISLLDLSTKQTTHTLDGFYDLITDLEYSPDGSTLAAGFGVYDFRVRLWNARTAEYLGMISDTDFPVDEIVYSPDGKTIAIDAYSYIYKAGMISVWNVESGEPITEINRGYYGLSDLHFSPDGKLLYAIHFDWPIAILIWQIPEKDAIERFEIKGNKFALSPDGSELAIVMFESLESPERILEIWDIHDIHNRQLVQSAVFELGWLDNLMYSPNGRYILFISEEDEHSTITQVEVETLQPVYTFDYESSLNNFDISDNGHYLAAGTEDGTILVWNLRTYELIALTKESSGSRISGIEFCPDGTCLATVSRDTITLWALEAME